VIGQQTTVVAGANLSLTLLAPATAPSGSIVAFDIQLANAGPDPASSLEVQFPVPTGFIVTGGLPGGCSLAGGTITCSVPGPIAPGGGTSIGPINGQISAASGSTVTGAATVQVAAGAPPGTPQDPDTGNNTGVRDISITAGSDVRISKARSVGGPYFVGDSFDFILTATYTGDSPSGLTITDVIPANYTIGALAGSQNGWTCGAVGQTVTCTRPSGGVPGANQSLGSVSIPVTINSSGPGVVNSTDITSASPFDPDLTNNTATDGGANLQDPTADLSLSKGGPSPALVVVGVPFDYTLTVSNGGPSEFFGTLRVTDQIPVGLTLNTVTPAGWTCLPAAPLVGPATLTCERDYTAGSPLASGANAPTITLNVTATAVGSITNTADLTTVNPNVPDPNPGNNSDNRGVTSDLPGDAADIFVLKTVAPDPVPAGDVLRYTLEIVNLGPVAAGSVTLTDNLGTLINNLVGPAGAGYVGETINLGNVAPGDLTCSTTSTGSSSRRLTCQVVTLPVCTQGGNCPTIDVEIRPGGNGGTRNNTASAISSVTADPVTANNSGSVSSTILARADITVTKTATPDPVAAGQELVYVVAARNNGPSRADNVTITDVLPLDVVFVSASPSAGSCTVTPGAGVVTTALNRTLSCGLNNINNGAQRTVTIRVKPTNATRGNTLTNDVTVATTTTEPPVPGATNNAATVDVDVLNPSLDLLIDKSEGLDPVAVAETTTYAVTVTNVGPSDAENVVITDDLPPAGLSFQGYTISAGTCGTVPAVGAIGGQVICTIPRLDSGTSATLTIDMQGEVKGAYVNDVQVESDETPLGFEDASNNTADESTTVRTRADMEIVSKVAAPNPIALRRPFNWTIRVRNVPGGPPLAEADSVEVSDNLPAGIELTGTPTVSVVSGTASETTCTGAAGDTSFTCDLGTVSLGAEVDITVPVRATSVPAGGLANNSATVSTFSLDVNPANNTNSGSVTVQGSTLSGTVFRDFADDGVIDATDTGMAGIAMTLTGTAFDGSPVSVTVNTDANGNFTLPDLPEGTYTIQRGAVVEPFLTVGQQVVGDRGGNAVVVPDISGIALGEVDTGTGYLFGFVPQARIGVAKRTLAAPLLNPDSSFTVDFRLVVE
ncbi:MAG: DUF11 domain-containing protein, partial [Gemmatimonadetes bacterium]|nr:DUF11 domain-containing protein [Gemmatimonadota bacterium]